MIADLPVAAQGERLGVRDVPRPSQQQFLVELQGPAEALRGAGAIPELAVEDALELRQNRGVRVALGIALPVIGAGGLELHGGGAEPVEAGQGNTQVDPAQGEIRMAVRAVKPLRHRDGLPEDLQDGRGCLARRRRNPQAVPVGEHREQLVLVVAGVVSTAELPGAAVHRQGEVVAA